MTSHNDRPALAHEAEPQVAASRPRVGATVVALTRQSFAGLRVLLALTLLLGVLYPLAVMGVGQVAFPWRANGSLVTAEGERRTSVSADVVGSSLLGQSFAGEEWFHPRPSAAGEGYDTLASAGSNRGPNDPVLLAAVEERRAAVAAEDGVDPSDVPADALTASASGLDPDISPEYAQQQVARVAAARGVPVEQVQALVDDLLQGRELGLFGEPRVNVVRLNIALTTMGA